MKTITNFILSLPDYITDTLRVICQYTCVQMVKTGVRGSKLKQTHPKDLSCSSTHQRKYTCPLLPIFLLQNGNRLKYIRKINNKSYID